MDRANQPADDSGVRLCTVCGVVTSRAGSSCTDHARQSIRSGHNFVSAYNSWAWDLKAALKDISPLSLRTDSEGG
jgi:hypothetical protein